MGGASLFRIFHSKVVSFERCRKQYWFRYLSGRPRPLVEATPPGVVGTGVHHAMKVLCETGDPAAGAAALDVYLRMPAHECAGPGTEAHALAFELFARGCQAHASIDSEDRWAEFDTWVHSPRRGIAVSARADRADRLAGGRWQLIDWKTGLAEVDELTDQQLDIAHLALRTVRRLHRDAPVTAIGWNLRTGNRRIRELTRDDARATMDRLAGIAARMQTVTDFEATPGPACGFCEWRPQCPEATAIEAGPWDGDDDLPDDP